MAAVSVQDKTACTFCDFFIYDNNQNASADI
jgi:hypothetical protein